MGHSETRLQEEEEGVAVGSSPERAYGAMEIGETPERRATFLPRAQNQRRVLPWPDVVSKAFLDAFVVTVLLPESPQLAGPTDIPLVIALMLGVLFLGRLCGTIWVYRKKYNAPDSSPSASPFHSAMALGVIVAVLWVAASFIGGVVVFLVCQFFIGLIIGSHIGDLHAPSLALLLGTMIGTLVGGLYDAQHAYSSLFSLRYASRSPVAPLGLAVLVTIFITVLIEIVCSCGEPYRGLSTQDAAYQRLEVRRIDAHTAGATPSAGGAAHFTPPSTTDEEEAGPAEVIGHDGGLPPIPVRFIRGMGGDMDEAKRRWRETYEWRQREGIDNILQEPQKDFELIKECYPHFLHRRDKFGHPIYYERLGYIDLKRLKASGVSVEEVLRYYVFLTEYIWRYVELDEDNGALCSVLDVENVGIMDLRGDALDFLKAASKIVQAHYPERSFKMFIINAPAWFSVLWKVIAPMLHENTRRKINILGRDYTPMLDVIDADSLPKKYGGRDTLALGESPEESRYSAFVEELNGRANSADAGTPTRTPRPPQPQQSSSLLSRALSGTSEPTLPRRTFSSSFRGRRINSGMGLGANNGTPGTGAEQPLTQRVGQGLVQLGQRVMGSVAAVQQRLLATADAPQANLGSENKFVYDQQRHMWVLNSAEGEPEPVDEAEERLIRAIQAAHGHIPDGGGPGAPLTHAPSPTRSFHSVTGSQRSRFVRDEEPPHTESSDGAVAWATFLSGVMLLWRGLGLGLLVVVPVWVRDKTGEGAGTIALVLFGGALLSLALWSLDAVMCGGGRGRETTWGAYRSMLSLLLGLTVMVALAQPLTATGSKDEVSRVVNGLAVAMTGLALLVMGGSVDSAVRVLQWQREREAVLARFELLPALALADLVGVLAAPAVLYAGQRGSRWPVGPEAYFNLAALMGIISLPIFGLGGRVALRGSGGV